MTLTYSHTLNVKKIFETKPDAMLKIQNCAKFRNSGLINNVFLTGADLIKCLNNKTSDIEKKIFYCKKIHAYIN